MYAQEPTVQRDQTTNDQRQKRNNEKVALLPEAGIIMKYGDNLVGQDIKPGNFENELN